MSDIPDRTIDGLNRRPDLSRLQAKNREPLALRPREIPLGEPASSALAAEEAPDLRPAAPPAPAVAAVPVPAPVPVAKQSKVKVGAYLDESLRNRARAAYTATRVLEGDETFSNFVERAIRAELQRREDLHNDGLPYEEETERLPPGRSQLD